MEIRPVTDPLALLRNEMAWFGHPISDMTDEEINSAVSNLAGVFAAISFTAEEAAQALHLLSQE